MHTYMYLSLSSQGLLSGVFCPGVLVWKVLFRVIYVASLLPEHIRYNRKVNITFNFRFHKCETKLKSAMSHALEPPSPWHKVRHAILVNFTPSPVTLCHTSRGPQKYVTHLGPPIFSRPSTKNPDKAHCTNSLTCSRRFCIGVLSEGLLSGRFCPGWFLSVPPSVRIHLLQQKVKHHFKFLVSYV